MRFDVEAARRDGYSDDEIADFLAQQRGFDIAKARADGYSTEELIGFLGEAKAPAPSPAPAQSPAPAPAPVANNATQLPKTGSAFKAGRGGAPTRAPEPKPSVLGLEQDKVGESFAKWASLPEAEQAKALAKIDPNYKTNPTYLDWISKSPKQQQQALARVTPVAPAEARAVPEKNILQRALDKTLDNRERPSAIGAVVETVGDIGRGVVRAVPDAAAGLTGLVQAGADAVGADGVAEFAANRGGQLRMLRDGLGNPLDPGSISQGAAQSLTQSLMFGRLAIPAIGANAAGNEYADSRSRGLTHAEAVERASVMGFTESLGEVFGAPQLAKLMKIAKDAPLADLRKAIKEVVVNDIGGELGTYTMQSAYEKYADLGLKPGMTLDEFASGAADVVKSSLAMSAMGGGLAAARRATSSASPAPAPSGQDYQALVNNTFNAPPLNLLERASAMAQPAPVAPTVESQPTTVVTPQEIVATAAAIPKVDEGKAQEAPAAPAAQPINTLDANDVLSTLGLNGGQPGPVARRGAGAGVAAAGPADAAAVPGPGNVAGEPGAGASPAAIGAPTDAGMVGQPAAAKLTPVDNNAPASFSAPLPLPNVQAQQRSSQSAPGVPDLGAGSASARAGVESGRLDPVAANAERVTAANAVFADARQRLQTAGRLTASIPLADLQPAGEAEVRSMAPILEATSEALGTDPVAIAKSAAGFDGVNWMGRTIVNVQGLQKPAPFVAVHESIHSIQNLARAARRATESGAQPTAEQADAQRIWEPMEQAIWDMVPTAERTAYASSALGVSLKEMGAWMAEPANQEELRREFMADFGAKRLTNPADVRALSQREPKLFGDFARKMIDGLAKVINTLRGRSQGLGANDVDKHIKDLVKAKLMWQDALVAWKKRGGANAAPVAMAQAAEQQPSKSGQISPERRSKIDEAAAAAREHVPGYAVDDAVAVVEGYPGAPEMAVPDADRARLEAAIAPLIDKAKALQPGFKARVTELAERLGGTPKVPGVKGLKRAAEKMFQEEAETGKDFDPAWLKDLVRGTIVVESMDDVGPAIAAVRETFTVTKIKDRFATPTESGYRDVLMNVDLNGMPAELQIHIPEMLAAKELGHLLYEVERALPNGDEKTRLQEAQTKFYGAAFDAATGAEPSFSARQASTKRSKDERDTTSSSSSFSNTTPVTADLGDSPGKRTTGSASLAKNTVPSGNDDKSITGTSNSDTSSDPSIVNQGSQPETPASQFDITTLKEGSLRVLGDVEAIRAALPDDVKGRKIPGGMLFSPSAAPRAKAALEGRKLAYSRAGQVIDKLPMKDGKYIGAPEKFNTPQKIPQLRKILRQLAEEGAPGRFWYENSSKEVLQMVGGDVNEARKFVALLAIYSPQAKVDTNSTFALRAWSQYKAGQPISVKTKVMDDKATAALNDIDAFWSGEKTGNFFNNLLREIDPSVADKQGATIDMWMMRAAQYESDAPSSTQYAFMENENNRIAKELGWEPQQVQAAIWVAMKARTENKDVKKATEESSEKRGWIRWAESMKGAPVRVILNAQKHRDNWLAKAMAHDVTKSDTQAAKFDFSDGVRRHIGQISWEARPGRSTGVLPGVNDAPYEQQVEFQQAVQKALYSDEGADLLAQRLGLLVDGPDILAPGVWQGEVAAGMQKQVAMAPGKGEDGKTVDPTQKQALDLYAATLGLLLRQEGVGWHRPFYKGKRSAENGVELRIGRPFTKDEAQSLWAAVDERMRAAGVADWEQGAGMISSPSGMRLVNFGAVDNNAKFRDLIQDAAATLAVEEVDPVFFSSDGNLVTNDWKEASRGQGFARTIREAGRSDLLGWAASVLAPRVQSVFDEFSSKYGWGNPGRVADLFDEPSFSGRPDAAGDRRDRGVSEGPEQGGPSYGVATPGAAAPVEAYHFSRQQRSSLSSAAYGSGLRGAEMDRVMRSSDTRLRKRVYFYVNQGTGIRPESGVGGYAHRVTLNNLYDTAKGEIKGAGNDFESAVLDAGYDGYLVRLPGQQSGQAVLLGTHNVPVEYLGMGAASIGQPAPVSQAAEPSSRMQGGVLVATKAIDTAAIRAKADIQAVAPSFRFEFGQAKVDPSDAALANAALEAAGSDLSFSARISPQSALDGAITAATTDLEAAISNKRRTVSLGRTPHVINMLGAPAKMMSIDPSIVEKVFAGKHAEELRGVSVGDVVTGLYRPAMVFKNPAYPNDYELVLPVPTKDGPLTAVIAVNPDDREAKIKSIYARSWKVRKELDGVRHPSLSDFTGGKLKSKLVYFDEYSAPIAVTGNKAIRTEADKTSAMPGRPLNKDHYLTYKDFAVKDRAERRAAKTEEDLLRYIGDNYTGDPADAPSFAARQPSAFRDELGRFRLPTGPIADKIGQAINRLLTGAKLNYASPEFRRQLRAMKLEMQKAQDVAVGVAQQMSQLSAGDRTMISAIVEKELAAGIAPPQHAVQIAAGISQIMEQQTNELIALGMLSTETADRLRGKYLPRFYESKMRPSIDKWAQAAKALFSRQPVMAGIKGKRLKGRGLWETTDVASLKGWEALGWEVRDPNYVPGQKSGTVQIWRDFTREERDQMGEIRDAGFRFVMGYTQAQKDIALGRMFQGIAGNPAMASPVEKADWVRVPDGTVDGTGAKRYGMLSGMWVSPEVFNHLETMDQMAGPAMKVYRKAMSMWKEGKTVLNPVSHANNVLSNLSMAHFAGVSYWDAHKYAGAIMDLARGRPMVQEAKDAGLFLGTMNQEELNTLLPPELRSLAKQQEGKVERSADFVWNMLSWWLRRPMGKAYEAEDLFFRYLIYRDARAQGLSPEDAVDHAQRYIFTYDDLPKNAQRIRDFGLPFFAYTFKVVPALLHTAAHYPHRMLAPAALLYGLNMAMYAMAVGDDDEDWLEKIKAYLSDTERRKKADELEASERENLPPWMKGYVSIGAPKAVRLGVDEALGLPLFWDVAQIMPGGNLFDMSNNLGGISVPQSLMPSHPLWSTALAMMANKDAYFGKPIVDENDTSAEAAQKRGEWIWRQVTPAIAAGNYHWERAMNVLAQVTGEPVTLYPWRDATGIGKDGLPVDPGTIALNTVGIKVRPIDLERSAEMAEAKRQALIRDIDKELRLLRRQNQAGFLSDANFEAAQEQAQLKKERLRDGLTVDGDKPK